MLPTRSLTAMHPTYPSLRPRLCPVAIPQRPLPPGRRRPPPLGSLQRPHPPTPTHAPPSPPAPEAPRKLLPALQEAGQKLLHLLVATSLLLSSSMPAPPPALACAACDAAAATAAAAAGAPLPLGYSVHALSSSNRKPGGTGGTAGAPTAVQKYSCTPMTDAERLYAYDLGGYNHPISTSSHTAQQLFNQGMALTFQFNREEAMRSFEAAIQQDPSAPLPHWGVAYALGPDLNKAAVQPAADPMDYPSFSPAELQRGLGELQRGLELADKQLSQSSLSLPQRQQLLHDRAYLSALLPVYQSGDTWGLQYRAAQADYALALEAISNTYPEDTDALPLAAEALFDLQPWDAWDPLTKAPVGRVLEVVDLLNRSLEKAPDQSLALHLLVHVTESLPTGRGEGRAGTGEAAADRLRASKQSFGHLVHMPSHTYHRVGRWREAVATNARAVEVETRDAQRCMAPYLPMHNMQVLLMGAGQGGDLGTAQAYADIFKTFPQRFGPSYMMDGRERAMLPLVWTRFGQWPQLQALSPGDFDYSSDGVELPRGAVQFNRAVYLYSKVLATASQAAAAGGARDQISSVEALVGELREVVGQLPPDPRTKPGPGLGMWTSGFNMAGRHLLQLGEGRLGLLQGAVQHLKQAVQVEAEELYAEPSYFYQPARQCLGAVLLQQGQYDEAAAVYKQDLDALPLNFWSEIGLSQAQQHLHPDQAPSPSSPLSSPDLALALGEADPSAPRTSSCPAFFN